MSHQSSFSIKNAQNRQKRGALSRRKVTGELHEIYRSMNVPGATRVAEARIRRLRVLRKETDQCLAQPCAGSES